MRRNFVSRKFTQIARYRLKRNYKYLQQLMTIAPNVIAISTIFGITETQMNLTKMWCYQVCFSLRVEISASDRSVSRGATSRQRLKSFGLTFIETLAAIRSISRPPTASPSPREFTSGYPQLSSICASESSQSRLREFHALVGASYREYWVVGSLIS